MFPIFPAVISERYDLETVQTKDKIGIRNRSAMLSLCKSESEQLRQIMRKTKKEKYLKRKGSKCPSKDAIIIVTEETEDESCAMTECSILKGKQKSTRKYILIKNSKE